MAPKGPWGKGRPRRPSLPSPKHGDHEAIVGCPTRLRLTMPEHPGTCLLLVEFQSTLDLRMAERMLEYAALLHGDLAREGRVLAAGLRATGAHSQKVREVVVPYTA